MNLTDKFIQDALSKANAARSILEGELARAINENLYLNKRLETINALCKSLGDLKDEFDLIDPDLMMRVEADIASRYREKNPLKELTGEIVLDIFTKLLQNSGKALRVSDLKNELILRDYDLRSRSETFLSSTISRNKDKYFIKNNDNSYILKPE